MVLADAFDRVERHDAAAFGSVVGRCIVTRGAGDVASIRQAPIAAIAKKTSANSASPSPELRRAVNKTAGR